MTPLIVHSYYSLMWGTASPRQVCRAARQLGYERLALTDTDNIYGLWPFLAACRREGLTPIVGAEVTDPGSGRRAVCLVETEKATATSAVCSPAGTCTRRNSICRRTLPCAPPA